VTAHVRDGLPQRVDALDRRERIRRASRVEQEEIRLDVGLRHRRLRFPNERKTESTRHTFEKVLQTPTS
jgi:hypothetical protein